tara:strand:+ start:1309 stop:1698 length:390 start_codon:yes stop_codon:yes gene_type:complete
MNIIGNGVDIVDNLRIKKSIKIDGFVERVFTEYEINQSIKSKNKHNFFAKRFAAKEALVKAIGTGFRNNINFKDIEVNSNKKGKPLINLSSNIKKFLKKKLNINRFKIYLSLSDEKNYSIAFVIINKIK